MLSSVVVLIVLCFTVGFLSCLPLVCVFVFLLAANWGKKVQVGKDQEKAQSEKDSHSKNRGGKKLN